MTKYLILVASFLFSFSTFAYVDETVDGISIYPQICFVWGEANLKFDRRNDTVEGVIGSDEVYLAFYQNFVYGKVQGFDITMNVNKNVAACKIGKVTFELNYKRGVISGDVPCIGPEDLGPGDLQ